jgi:hypothetical protein
MDAASVKGAGGKGVNGAMFGNWIKNNSGAISSVSNMAGMVGSMLAS